MCTSMFSLVMCRVSGLTWHMPALAQPACGLARLVHSIFAPLAPTCAAGSWLPRQVFKHRERVSSHGSLGAQCALVYQSAPMVFGGLVGYRPAWAQTVRFCIRALSPAPRVDGWHSVLGRRVFTQRSPLAQHAWPKPAFGKGWLCRRASLHRRPCMRSRKLAGTAYFGTGCLLP